MREEQREGQEERRRRAAGQGREGKRIHERGRLGRSEKAGRLLVGKSKKAREHTGWQRQTGRPCAVVNRAASKSAADVAS